jgi:photosystem II stability/assembly factor-like uncharacterized protein
MAVILYLGTEQGVLTLKSDDGRSWKVESHGLKEWAVPKVTSIPSAPNRVFAGTRGDGVWVSEDFGKSWKKPCYGKRGPGKVRCVTVHPHDSNTLYAGTEPIDVFVSHDAAKSWERLDSLWNVPWVPTVDYPVPTVEPHARDVAVDPKDPKKLYVALQVGYMLKSVDEGSTWKLLNKDLDADVHTIVINPENPANLYIATGGDNARQGKAKGKALYASKDGGESWAPLAMDFPLDYSVPFAMHPKNPSILYSALANSQPGDWRSRPSGAESVMIRSRDGGSKWEKLEKGLSGTSRNFPEAIVIDQANPERLYAGFRSGELFGSEDSGDSWTKVDVKVPAVADMKCLPV